MDFMEWQKAKQIETHNFTVNSFFGWYYVLFPPLQQTFDTCFDKIIRNIHIFSVSYIIIHNIYNLIIPYYRVFYVIDFFHVLDQLDSIC